MGREYETKPVVRVYFSVHTQCGRSRLSFRMGSTRVPHRTGKGFHIRSEDAYGLIGWLFDFVHILDLTSLQIHLERMLAFSFAFGCIPTAILANGTLFYSSFGQSNICAF
ncbi:hypothetical protein D915_009318 [Fasciola hepatica]|uniref:Uncharacterized protein n=1 Tax=Fasciola hepatica TaxID=6192 RepID=A0A4E0RCN0_FASHE|nr:hypothetical protein D915_009318 [Fasciola hepatica]